MQYVSPNNTLKYSFFSSLFIHLQRNNTILLLLLNCRPNFFYSSIFFPLLSSLQQNDSSLFAGDFHLLTPPSFFWPEVSLKKNSHNKRKEIFFTYPLCGIPAQASCKGLRSFALTLWHNAGFLPQAKEELTPSSRVSST